MLSHTTMAKPYIVRGISGEMLENVNKRLALLEEQSNLSPAEKTSTLHQNIIQALQPFGYYTPTIYIKGKQIAIDKGFAVTIRQIQLLIDGPGKFIFNKQRKKLPIEIGQPFNSEQYQKAKQQLFDIAEHNGFLNARFLKSKVIVNPQSKSAIIILHFNTGVRFHFGQVRFTNNTFYDHAFLKRYLTFQPKQPYDTDKLLSLTEALNNSGYFSQVAVTPEINHQRPSVPVNINLTDKPSQNYTLGLGFGTDTGIRGRAGWQWLRVTPTGHTFKALFQGSQKQNTLQAQYFIPGQDPTKEQLTFSASIFQLSYPVGKSRAHQLAIARLRNINNSQYTYGINYLAESFNYIGQLKVKKSALIPFLKYQYKQIESPLFSKNGFSINVLAQGSSRGLLSEVSFIQGLVSAKYAAYLPSHSRLFLKGSLATTQTADISQLPLSLQQLAGGADSIRGYHFQSIGLGKQLVTSSIELQQAFKTNWYLTAFYDIGDVYQPSPLNWRRGVGGGMMWVSPIGPIRLSIARALDERRQPFRIIFNMGPDLWRKS